MTTKRKMPPGNDAIVDGMIGLRDDDDGDDETKSRFRGIGANDDKRVCSNGKSETAIERRKGRKERKEERQLSMPPPLKKMMMRERRFSSRERNHLPPTMKVPSVEAGTGCGDDDGDDRDGDDDVLFRHRIDHRKMARRREKNHRGLRCRFARMPRKCKGRRRWK